MNNFSPLYFLLNALNLQIKQLYPESIKKELRVFKEKSNLRDVFDQSQNIFISYK